MLTKITTLVLNWALTAIIMPALYFIYDVYKLRKENKELKKVIDELKQAKTKTDIDSSFDRIP